MIDQDYSEFRYLWPPRPEKAIMPEMISFYQRRGFVAQAKLNGSCSVIAITPDRKMIAMNRHNEAHKLWTPTESNLADFAELPGKGWYVFVAELMHAKVPGIRDVNYVHDVLVADGVSLTGETFLQRQERLEALFLRRRKGSVREFLTHWQISPTLWLAKNHVAGLGDLFEKMVRPEHEGLVLKNPNAPLSLCLRQSDNASWQVKVRRPHKNYSF